MLTHQMVTVLSLFLKNTNTRIEQLNRQVNRIATVVNSKENDNYGLGFNDVNQNDGAIPNYNVHISIHGQNADNMLERLGQNNIGGLCLFFLNLSNKLNYLRDRSFLNEESSVEHIARYTVKINEVASNEYLKMKFFPSSLTRNAFIWFSNLKPNSIHSWRQLEKDFHKQFFRSELRISLNDLFFIKRNVGESIDKYFAKFKNMRNRCCTSVPDSKIVKIAINGLEFGIRKKLVNQHYHDMTQLTEYVRQM
ncbi:hypothetical protein Ahy_B01g054995 [Arachis hypogaea]|uniref:Retrotransposon gag domain-containing protein n=1 Tax=Arachis hypogaea TaxID=3818 RepID=A0A445AUT7_ARAHY|nr:hypothetical protein Ahy_B01g054995 [Arachis hypogaea]